MTKTFTLPKNLQEHLAQNEKDRIDASGTSRDAVFIDGPSAQCIRNILNFSKNLDVRPSEHLGHLVYLKS